MIYHENFNDFPETFRKDFELAENELTDDPKRLSLLRSYPAHLLPSFNKLIRNENLVAASDAFFPFVDSIEKLVQSGVQAVIQPSGSIRDKEIIKFANETDTVLVFSKTRHFRH